MDPGTALLIAKGLGGIFNFFGNRSKKKAEQKDFAAQTAWEAAERNRAVADRNAEAAAAKKAANQRFDMAMGILMGMEDGGGVPKHVLAMLNQTRDRNPLTYTSSSAAPTPQAGGFNFFSTLGNLANMGGDYLANKEQADDYASEYNSRAQAPNFGGAVPGRFGSSVDFGKGVRRPLPNLANKGKKDMAHRFTFDDLYKFEGEY